MKVCRMDRRWLYAVVVLLMASPMGAKKRPEVPDSLRTVVLEVNGVPLTTKRVEGGSFIMGATSEQYDPDIYTDKPSHLVFLSPFYIAATEVTCRLWKAVMPDKEVPGCDGDPLQPVSYVSWYDCQEFVRRLDSITGYSFRLPSEAEWEYAARGGAQSERYRFAGSDIADSVGWLYGYSGNRPHPIARKHPNELGLYDMTGNVAEWCQDLFGTYQLSTLPDPLGADTGSYRVVRGGSYDECKANSHLSVRHWYRPETEAGYIGFRVAFTLPDDPMTQKEQEEPALVRNIRIKGKKLRFALVPNEQPYYISDEISVGHWRRVTGTEPPDKENGNAIGMTLDARMRFAEQCSRMTQQPMAVATGEQTQAAVQQGVIVPAKKKQRDRSTRAVQRSRRTRAKLSPWAEMVGVRLSMPDDPVLLEFKGDANEKRPLRLILRIKPRLGAKK